jgi:hypothetical protein
MMDDAMMGVGLLFKGVVLLGYYFYKSRVVDYGITIVVCCYYCCVVEGEHRFS